MNRIGFLAGYTGSALLQWARTNVRYEWVRWLTVGAFAAALVFGLVLALRLGTLASTVADVAINVAASVIVAVTAVVVFSVGTHRRIRQRLLAYQRGVVAAGQPSGRWPNQARALVTQLCDDRHHAALLLETPPGGLRASFVEDLVAALSRANIVALVIPQQRLDHAGPAAAASDEFRALLGRAGLTDVPFLRILEALARSRRIVVVIDGVDVVNHPTDRASMMAVAADRARDLIAANLPFLAVVDPGSIDPDLGQHRVTLPTIEHSEALVMLGVDGTDEDGEHRAATEQRFAAAMQYSLLTIESVVRQRRVDGRRLAALTRRLTENGRLWVAFRVLREAGYPRVGGEATPLVERLARRMALLESIEVEYAELLGELAEDELEGFAGQLATLERQRIVARRRRQDRLFVRFADPEVGEAAVGVWLAGRPRPYEQSRLRGGTAFAAEAVQRVRTAGSGRDRAWRGVLRSVRDGAPLSAFGDAFAALLVSDEPVVFPTVDWMDGAWETADQVERMLLVQRIPGRAAGAYTEFLWSRVKPPAFNRNSHLMRRVIARHLGRHGVTSWDRLRSEWSGLVKVAEQGRLAWYDRRVIQPWPGMAVASLCWVLPSVALSRAGDPEPGILLRRLAAATVPGGGSVRDGRPDVGLEISLAEGCKDAAYLALTHGYPVADSLWQVVVELGMNGRSWLSRIVAMQAAMLLAAVEPARMAAVGRLCLLRRDADNEHEIARRYARVLVDALREPPERLRRVVNRYVWPDDTEALDAAGGELTDESALALAAMTIVLNFGESRRRVHGDPVAAQSARVRALVYELTPSCMSRPLAAAAARDLPCDCALRLCGPDLRDIPDMRPISRIFAYRCLTALQRQWRNPREALRWQQALWIHLRRAAI
ncbi:hypothetical protein AB0J90_06990 [Micromonospora sp. NPDC049523]|uniref:hypothetical protein n=1 Tax=Micromonospora sp. NPDC049523 TaxID=3155921 RepID=UPI00341D9D29